MDAVHNDEYKSKLYTTEYIDSLPEGERAELIDGKLYMEAKDRISTSPNGNAGWYSSMCRAGLDKILADEGIEWIDIFAVDNVLQRIADPCFVGATLIVVGVVWTCRQLSSPTQLNAAQGTKDSGLARFSLPQKGTAQTSTPAPKKPTARTLPSKKIRSTSTASELSLSVVEPESATKGPSQLPAVETSPIVHEPDPFSGEGSILANDLGTAPDVEFAQSDPLAASRPVGSLHLMSDEDELENGSFPALPASPTALPLENESVLPDSEPMAQTPLPPSGSSLSLQEVEEDFPQPLQPEGPLATSLEGDETSALEEEPRALPSP